MSEQAQTQHELQEEENKLIALRKEKLAVERAKEIGRASCRERV